MSRHATAVIVGALFCIVLYLMFPPLGMLIFGAVTDTPPATQPHFSLETLLRAWGVWAIYPALLESLIFAAFTSTLVLLFAIVLLWIVERSAARVGTMANLFVLAPIIMPAVLLVNGWIM